MKVVTVINIEKNKIPNSYKIYGQYDGNYIIDCWIDIEKVKHLFEEKSIPVELIEKTNILEIIIETNYLHSVVLLLEKYEFIKKLI